ncbi:uncharacterized protein [Cherax quadricarinatus]|uniref:uncharacterized protein isoform X1 n=1 Tax=Cherax quadricarinatus TaxID=27406 RepID=UPI00387E5CD2
MAHGVHFTYLLVITCYRWLCYILLSMTDLMTSRTDQGHKDSIQEPHLPALDLHPSSSDQTSSDPNESSSGFPFSSSDQTSPDPNGSSSGLHLSSSDQSSASPYDVSSEHPSPLTLSGPHTASWDGIPSKVYTSQDAASVSDNLSYWNVGACDSSTVASGSFSPDQHASGSQHIPCDQLSLCDQQTFYDVIPEEHRVESARVSTRHRGNFASTARQPRRHAPRGPEPCLNDGGSYTPPLGRFAKLGKVSTPGRYQSSSLGRPSRRGRLVVTPKFPDVFKERETRSQTEPPSGMATPDLLQVSWVWESRLPTRSSASVRRRPSCRVSCRRRPRTRLTPRRAPSSSSTSHHSHTPVDDEEVDHDKGFCSGGEMSDNSDVPEDKIMAVDRVMPDVVMLDKCSVDCKSNRTMTTAVCSVEVKEAAAPSTDTQQVTLRKKTNSSYLHTVSKSLKQKWRNSDLFFPKLFSETINIKSNEVSGNRKSILEKAKDLPLQMKKISCFLFKNQKGVKNVDIIMKGDDAAKFYLEMKKTAETVDRRRKYSRHPSVPIIVYSSVGVKGQCSFSPRNSFRRCKTLNWNQKYKTVMDSRRQEESSAPAILVTSAEEQVIPDTQDGGQGVVARTQDNASLTQKGVVTRTLDDGLKQHLHPLQQGCWEDKQQQGSGGVLDRLLGRLRRPRSLSTSRSRASSRSSMSGGSEDGHSPSHSSDYEDHDDVERTGSASLVGRMRGLRRDMQKKISRLKSPRGSTSSSPGPVGSADKAGTSLAAPANQQPAASSYESIPTSAPLAATASGSNRSSLSGEEAEPYTGPFIGRARALVDCQPSPYDRDALKFKKGDIIDIIAKNPSGLWKGCVEGRVGHFKFILVEEEVERPARRTRAWRGTTPRRGRARTLEEILTRLHLGHLIQVFVLNGYEDLDQFRDLEKADLDCLGITDPETCAKLLTAVALLHDADSEPEPDPPETLETTEAALRRGDHGRDSGCYTDHRSTHTAVLDENNLDTRQSTPSTDNSSGYHSRGAYNIPVGEATQTSRDDPQSSALESPPSESTATGAAGTLPSSTQAESHSYRAHLATVLPSSPRSQSHHSHAGEHKKRQDPHVDFEAKFVTARSVFEKDLVRREVPFTVRAQKRGMGSSHSLTGETEDGEKYDTSVAASEFPSP